MIFVSLIIFFVREIAGSAFVQDTPFFAAPIQNTTALLGETARLACVVENLGPYQVAWVHQVSGAVLTVGDRVLTSNTRITVSREQRNTWVLGIINVTRNDAGEYMCQVSTSPPRKLFGFLSIVEPPVFEWHSQVPRVGEGQSAILECHARGNPSPTIVWRREDDQDIRINTSLFVRSFKGSILTLYDASPRTSGSYICVASNGHPPSVSRVLRLRVIHAPVVEFVSADKHIWMRKGDTVNLSCRYAAYPMPQVVFHRENYFGFQNLSVNHFEIKRVMQQFPYTHTMTLTIARIHDSDFGNYSCIVTNEFGQAYDYLILQEIPTPPTTTTTVTMTTLRITSADPEIEGRAPIPLRDGSFTSIPNSTYFQNVLLRTTTEGYVTQYDTTKKNGDQNSNLWSKKIARINISENSKSGASLEIFKKNWILSYSLLLTYLTFYT